LIFCFLEFKLSIEAALRGAGIEKFNIVNYFVGRFFLLPIIKNKDRLKKKKRTR